MSAVRSTLTLAERLLEHGIRPPHHDDGTQYLTCPKCSHTRHKDHAACLSLTIDEDGKHAVWKCHHCGWADGIRARSEYSQKTQQAEPPKPQRSTPVPEPGEITQRALGWLAERGISEAVARRNNQVGAWSTFIPGKGKVDCVAFCYRRNGELINIKSRALNDKAFIQIKGAEPVLYKLDDIAGQAEIIITEGEFDALACEEAGYRNAVSVPNGAGVQSGHKADPNGKAFEYLAICASYLDAAEKIVLALDNDETGRALESVLLRRLGRERCWRVTWPAGCKDANDVLMRRGRDVLCGCIEAAEPYQADVSDIEDEGNTENENEAGADNRKSVTDDKLARKFVAQYKSMFRYVEDLGGWLIWNGKVWKRDKMRRIRHLLREFLREEGKSFKVNPTVKKIDAIQNLLRDDPSYVREDDVWDLDPLLLNTPGGIVDLITGKLMPHDPNRHMTKITAVAPDDRGDCPLWRKVLDQAMNGDQELVAFVQRMLGYCLTGTPKEHALFFCYGDGGNGKGLILNTVGGIMEDYAAVTPIETLMACNGERHPTDVARLRGARLVSAQEVEEGQRWAESKIKWLTGGDTLVARFMGKDFMEFKPQFKLVIAGNNKPSLRSVDEAIRRRFHMIPFEVVIPKEQRDPNLPEKLKAEWLGILRWMIDGCIEYQRIGLAAPQSVIGATEDYLEAEDSFNQWLIECCQTGEGCLEHRTKGTELFTSWQKRCEDTGERPGNAKILFNKLEKAGFTKVTPKGSVAFKGIKIKPIPWSGSYS